MALTLTPNGVTGCSPWRQPWGVDQFVVGEGNANDSIQV